MDSSRVGFPKERESKYFDMRGWPSNQTYGKHPAVYSLLVHSDTHLEDVNPDGEYGEAGLQLWEAVRLDKGSHKAGHLVPPVNEGSCAMMSQQAEGGGDRYEGLCM